MNVATRIIIVFTVLLSFASELNAGVEIIKSRQPVCGKDKICTPGNIFVLSIAINRFEQADGIPNQAFAVADAVSIAQQFPASFSGVSTGLVNGRTLTDKEVTRERIRAEFEAIAREIDVNDLFVFSYSGIGWQQTFDREKGPEFSFPLVNVKSLTDQENFISVSELRSMIRGIRARNKLIILDSCHSGKGSVMTEFAEHESVNSRSDSNVVLIAVSGDEMSYETPKLQHGIMTKALLDGLQGEADLDGDGKISAQELAAYADFGVRKLTHQVEMTRFNLFTDHVGMDFQIALTEKTRRDLARQKKQATKSRAEIAGVTGSGSSTSSPARDGDDYALLFANDTFDDRNWPTLDNPQHDVDDIARELIAGYGYKKENVRIERNLTTAQMRVVLDEYANRKFTKPDDQLLVYFAGHGHIDEQIGDQFYVGKDSPKWTYENQGSFLSLKYIVNRFAAFNIAHSMAVFDVCFAGKVWEPTGISRLNLVSFAPFSDPFKGYARVNRSNGPSAASEFTLPGDPLVVAKRLMKDDVRLVMTSGDRPVDDSFKLDDGSISRNSPFADRFLKKLRNGGDPDDAGVLTAREIQLSARNLGVEPSIGTIGKTKGDFVFVPGQR